jgi:TPR repeat protein
MLVDACRVGPQPDGIKFAVAVKAPAFTAPPGGIGVLFSCSRGEASWESDTLRHGVFFHYVLEGLRGKAGNDKGEVLFEALAAYAKSKVDDHVKDERKSALVSQTPHSLGDIRGSFPLVRGNFDVREDWARFAKADLENGEDVYLREWSKTRLRRWKQAAEGGLDSAQVLFAACLRKGIGVEKDARAAVRWYRLAAEQDHAAAQNGLGVFLANGLGVEKDEQEAACWFRKAAQQNHARAQFNLGRCYATSMGVDQDAAEAARWYCKAAEQGFAPAQNNLGHCYETGFGVGQNAKEAVAWYRKAARQGFAPAQNNLGYSYARGFGVDQDPKEAVLWYRKAALQDLPAGQYNLARCHEEGRGVEKDVKEAVRWYSKAASQGNEDAKKALERLRK